MSLFKVSPLSLARCRCLERTIRSATHPQSPSPSARCHRSSLGSDVAGGGPTGRWACAPLLPVRGAQRLPSVYLRLLLSENHQTLFCLAPYSPKDPTDPENGKWGGHSHIPPPLEANGGFYRDRLKGGWSSLSCHINLASSHRLPRGAPSVHQAHVPGTESGNVTNAPKAGDAALPISQTGKQRLTGQESPGPGPIPGPSLRPPHSTRSRGPDPGPTARWHRQEKRPPAEVP